MQVIGGWQWRKIWFSPEKAKAQGNIALCEEVFCLNKGIDWAKIRENETVLITGDGKSLAEDVRTFESWNVPHDLYCVNRSLIFFERQVDHWAAIDIEESAWFAQNLTGKIMPRKEILRHTIGEIALGYDIYWERKYPFTNDQQRRLFIGNSGYFAALTAIAMGYRKIVLAGMPLDNRPHFYDPDDAAGPNWNCMTYMQWIDFRQKSPHAYKVRSMGSYSAFILGQAEKEWLDALPG